MKKIWGEIWCWVATIIIEGKRRCWEVMVLTSPYSPFTSFSSVWKVTSKLVSAQHPRLSCRTTSHLSWKCNPCSLIRGPWNISNYLHFTVGFTVKDLKMMISNDVVRLSKPLKVKGRSKHKNISDEDIELTCSFKLQDEEMLYSIKLYKASVTIKNILAAIKKPF